MMCILLITASVCAKAPLKVVAISGSTRKESINKFVLDAVVKEMHMRGATVITIDLHKEPLPFYSADNEAVLGMPGHVRAMRRALCDTDLVVIASPEYNGSLTGALKNFIDWMTRSEDAHPSYEAFAHKVCVIISASPGKGGGARGLRHLREILTNVHARVHDQEIVVPHAYELIDHARGLIQHESVMAQIASVLDAVME